MSNSRIEIPKNIMSIIEKASDYVGMHEAESFSQDIFSRCIEGKSTSPIEMAFLIAYYAVARINFVDHCEPIDSDFLSAGIWISPQHPIGSYKADFMVGCVKVSRAGTYRQIAVECDGTAFHERTESERRKEKLRDRYMQKLNIKVFRYTGTEILKDPYKVAAEVIGYVTDQEEYIITPENYFS